MPVYEITGPDGVEYEVDAPNDVAVQAAVAQMFGGAAPAGDAPAAPPAPVVGIDDAGRTASMPGFDPVSSLTPRTPAPQPIGAVQASEGVGTVEPEQDWLDYFAGSGAVLLDRVKGGAAKLAGLPVDLMNVAPMALNLLPGEQGIGPITDRPVFGSEFNQDLVRGFGAMPSPEPQDAFQRILGRVGEELGASAIPAGAALRAGSQLSAAAARDLGPIARLFGVEQAAIAPNRFLFGETLLGGGAGLGAGLVNEVTGNQDQSNGYIDAGGAVAGALGVAGGAGLGGSVANILKALGGSKNYTDDVVRGSVAAQIAEAAGLRPAETGGAAGMVNTDDLVAAIQNGGSDVERLMPGFKETLGDRTGNPGIGALEYGRQDGDNAGLFRDRVAANTKAVDQAMGGIAPEGTPGQLSGALGAERTNRLDAAAATRTAATDAYTRAVAPLQPLMTGEGRGAGIRSALEDASDAARAAVAEAWAPVNAADAAVDIDPLRAAFDDTTDALPLAERDRFKPREADTPGRLATDNQLEEFDDPVVQSYANWPDNLRNDIDTVQRRIAAETLKYETKASSISEADIDKWLAENDPNGSGIFAAGSAEGRRSDAADDAMGEWDRAYRHSKESGTLKRAYDELAELRGYEQQIMQGPTPRAAPIPVREVSGIRSALSSILRQQSTTPQEARIVQQYISRLDDFLERSVPDELRGQYEAARGATRDFSDRFRRPTTAIAQTLDQREGRFKVPDSAVTRKFLADDQGRLTDFEDLMRETGSDTRVRESLRDQIVQDVRSNNLIDDPDGLNDYLSRYGRVFREFPDLRNDLGNVAQLRARVTEAQEGEEALRTLLTTDRSTVGRYLSYGDENAAKAMKGVIASREPGKAADELLSFVNDQPAAVEGARKVFWDLMNTSSRARGRDTADVNGAQPWSPGALRAFLSDPPKRAVMERLWRDRPETLEALDAFSAALSSTDLRKSARSPNSSGTALGLRGALPSAETVASRAFAFQRGQVGLTWLGTSLGLLIARKAVTNARQQAIGRMLDDVLLNPDSAAILLKENNPANRRAFARKAKLWFGNEASSIVNELGDEDDDEDEVRGAITRGME